MRKTLPLAVMLIALPRLAAAQQEMPGLDLSDESKGSEAPKAPERTSARPEVERERPGARAEPKESKDSAPKLTEAEIASEDRVKSVQRKAALKRGRFDLTPMMFVTLNDAFYPVFGPGARISYHPANALALGLRYQQFNRIPEDNVRLAKRQLQSRLPSVLPQHSFGLDLLWSPIYGKVALFNSIRHFDLYVLGGAGLMLSQTSAGNAPTGGDGPHLTTSLGLGQRFGLTDWMAVDLSVIETLYSDRPQGYNKSILQHALTLNVGVSFFLPTAFEYKEP